MITHEHHLLAKRLAKSPMKPLLNDLFLEILEVLFTREEALLLSKIPMMPATAEKIARRANRPAHEVQPVLDRMGEQGFIFAGGDDVRKYFLLGFLPGIFEFYTVMGPDDEKKLRFAELYEEYQDAEFLTNLAGKRPVKITRVIPIQKSLSHQTGIIPSDSFREVIDRHDAWAVAICACKKQNELIGNKCEKPQEVCMQFGAAARGAANMGFSRLVSRKEIFEIVDEIEAAGLVHVTDNVETPHIACNCCGCCCIALECINKFNTPSMFVENRFVCEHDPGTCVACGKCAKACPVNALQQYDKQVSLQPWRCIGCGVCVSRCKENALKLVPNQGRHPVPENYGQMIVDSVSQLAGVQKYARSSIGPRFSFMLGNWLQDRMTKKR